MDITTFNYALGTGWSIDTFPNLDSENTLIIAFCDQLFIDMQAPFADLLKHFPKSTLVGCSTAGQIANFVKNSHTLIQDKCISVAVIRFANTKIMATAAAISNTQDSFHVGHTLAQALKRDKLKGSFVLAEGLNINASELIRGLNTLDNQTIIAGGLAGDDARFQKTWVMHNNHIASNMVVAIGFYGEHIQIGHGTRGGWETFGPERRITRSKNNILYELDGMPALMLYKDYLGDKAAGLPATGLLFPLAIRKDEANANELVRTILAVDESEQALIFAGDIPQGYMAKLMYANFDRLITGAFTAGQLSAEKFSDIAKKNSPMLAIVISCVGRRLVLGERSDEEVEALRSALPQHTEIIGFYSYGELSPLTDGTCDLHNQTMTITTFMED